MTRDLVRLRGGSLFGRALPGWPSRWPHQNPASLKGQTLLEREKAGQLPLLSGF